MFLTMRKCLFVLAAMAMFMLTSCFRTSDKQENAEKNDTVVEVIDTVGMAVDTIGETVNDTVVVLFENE